MADCNLIPQGEKDGKTLYVCKWCKLPHSSRRRPEEIHRQCAARPNHGNAGPGTELKKLLATIGITASSCDCESHAAEMNANGSQWCRDNLDTIVGWLEEEAKKRKLAKLVFSRTIARGLVLRAIRNAEKQSRRLD